MEKDQSESIMGDWSGIEWLILAARRPIRECGE